MLSLVTGISKAEILVIFLKLKTESDNSESQLSWILRKEGQLFAALIPDYRYGK